MKLQPLIQPLKTPAGVLYGYRAAVKDPYAVILAQKEFVAERANQTKAAYNAAVRWARQIVGEESERSENPLRKSEQRQIFQYAKDDLKRAKRFEESSTLSEYYKGQAEAEAFIGANFGAKKRRKQSHRIYARLKTRAGFAHKINPLNRREQKAIARVAREHDHDSRTHKSAYLKAFDKGTAAGLREASAMTKRKNPLLSERVSSDEAQELYLYITGDGDLYRQKYMPIVENLRRKIKRGIFQKELAVKLVMYLVDNGARKYIKEFSTPMAKMQDVFPKPVRLEVAREILEDMLSEYSKNPSASGARPPRLADRKNPRYDIERGYIRTHIDGQEKELSEINGTLVMTKNPLRAGGRYAGFTHKRLLEPSQFDPRSFRTKHISPSKQLLIGCPKGHYDPRRQSCAVGTKAQALLTRKNPSGLDKPMGEYKGVLIWRNGVNGMFYALRVGAADTIKGIRKLIDESLRKNPKEYRTLNEELVIQGKPFEDFVLKVYKVPFHTLSDTTLREALNEYKAFRTRKNPTFHISSGSISAGTPRGYEDFDDVSGTLRGRIQNPPSKLEVGDTVKVIRYVSDDEGGSYKGSIGRITKIEKDLISVHVTSGKWVGHIAYFFKKDLIKITRYNPPPLAASGAPSGAVLIAPHAKAVEYYDEKKARAEGLPNPSTPWRHGYKKGVKIFGLPDKRKVLLVSKKKIWDYR